MTSTEKEFRVHNSIVCEFNTSKLGKVFLCVGNNVSGLRHIHHNHSHDSPDLFKSKFAKFLSLSQVLVFTVKSGALSVHQCQRSGVRYASKWAFSIGTSLGKPTCCMDTVVIGGSVRQIMNGWPIPCNVQDCPACKTPPPKPSCFRMHISLCGDQHPPCSCGVPVTYLPLVSNTTSYERICL
jgi:hypothetical protein